MKAALRCLCVMVMAFLFSAAAQAQVKTVVSGTVTDPNGVPYAGGTISADLIPSGSSPTVGGNQINGFIPPAPLDSNGHFSMSVFCNVAGGGCDPIQQPGSQWRFTVSNRGAQPPVGFGPVSFTAAVTVTGATQDLSTTLSALAPALYRVATVTGCAVAGSLGDLQKNNGTGGCVAAAVNDSGGTLLVGENAVLKGPSPYIDVRGYGVKCDGSTDDSINFGNALAAAQAGPTNGVRTVAIPGGGKCKLTTGYTILTRGIQIIGNLGERPEESGGASIEYTPATANTTLFSLGAPKITTITSIARLNNVVTLVYAPLPPGGGSFKLGSSVVIAGETSDTSFNGNFTVSTNSVGSSTMTYAQTGANATPAAAGTVAGALGNADFDGVQGFSMRHLEIRCDGSQTTPLDNGVTSYCTGTVALQDNRGGDVLLDDINFERWQYGFYGIQSDVDKFTNVNGGKNHVMIFVGPRSDQMKYQQMYAGNNDVDLWIEGARGGDYRNMISVDSGSPISAPFRCESTFGTCAFNVFDHPWLEHSGAFADQLAFFELGGIQQIDSPGTANNIFIKRPEVHVNTACCGSNFFTHHLVVANFTDFVTIDDPIGNVNNFTSLVDFEGATSPGHIQVNKFGNNSFTLSTNGGSGTPDATQWDYTTVGQVTVTDLVAGSFTIRANGTNAVALNNLSVSNGVTVTSGNVGVAGNGAFGFSLQGGMHSSASGKINFLDGSNSSFTSMTFGPETASFPQVHRNGAMLDFKLGDNSAYTQANAAVVGLQTPITVAALPAAASSSGQMRTVSDSTAVTAEGQTCVGSGTALALAFSNGTVWKCF